MIIKRSNVEFIVGNGIAWAVTILMVLAALLLAIPSRLIDRIWPTEGDTDGTH